MNKYLKNLHKIEFVVTYACTGHCKHCSQGDHAACGVHIDPATAAKAVRKVASVYDIHTVMTFGGEGLLYPEVVYAVMCTANELGIPRRQVITNGYFSSNPRHISQVAENLARCGVNDLVVSVDAFHQETIPLDVVRLFVAQAKAADIPLRLQPAWLKSPVDDNLYNRKTREILHSFADMGLFVGEGNIIFPEGNATKHLAEYFTDTLPENPYINDPQNVCCLSFSPDGKVLGGNAYQQDILEILQEYTP